MPGLTYEEIVQKICTEKSVSQDEIEAKVKDKLNQLSDLISKQGAAHIVANEYGVRVYEQVAQQRKVKVKELLPALRGVEVVGKVMKVDGVRSFNTGTREGRVCNLMIADETGQCRLVIWDEKQLKEIEAGALKEGDIVKVLNAYVRSNTFSGNELHMGSQASWEVNPEGVTIENVVAAPVVEKKKIKDLNENDVVSVVGTVVQIFEPRFYDSCPTCRKKVVFGEDGGVECATHGKVESVPQAILNLVFDDGTDNIRVVCFRDVVNKVLEVEEAISLRDNAEEFRKVQRNVAGKQLQIHGRVTKNTFFDRLELTANRVEDADPKQMAMELENK